MQNYENMHREHSYTETRCTILFLLLCLPMTGMAEIYRCINAEGKPVTSDRLLPECRNRLIKVYTDKGRFKSEILPPLTEREIREKEKERERMKALEVENAELQREERYLSAHYRNEADIESARKRAIETINGKKKLAEEQLVSLASYISELEVELSTAKKSSNNLQALKNRAEELNRSIQKNQELLKLYDLEIARVNREFEQTLDRYRVVVLNKRRFGN